MFLFYFSYIYLQKNALKKIRILLFIIFFLISAGFFSELVLGIQLVSGNDQLEVSAGAFKGFFFNTNDQAVVATVLCTAVVYFYIIKKESKSMVLIGYFILLVLGIIIFVSASRAALVAFLFILFIALYLSASKIFKIFYAAFSLIFLLFIFNIRYLKPILDFLAGFSWLERSVQRLELAIFSLDEDNSVGYRTEIYQKFIDNFKIVWVGYGPRNYEGYFKDYPLSYSLGYANPHSFFIEIYLAFGLFAFIFFIAFLLQSALLVCRKKTIYSSQKFFFILCILIFCWLLWVPSSVLRLSLIWYPLLLILLYMLLYESNSRKINSGI